MILIRQAVHLCPPDNRHRINCLYSVAIPLHELSIVSSGAIPKDCPVYDQSALRSPGVPRSPAPHPEALSFHACDRDHTVPSASSLDIRRWIPPRPHPRSGLRGTRNTPPSAPPPQPPEYRCPSGAPPHARLPGTVEIQSQSRGGLIVFYLRNY